MRRISVLILLPLILFGLERVNLIKDHSFEKDSEVWHTYRTSSGFPNIVAEVNRHDTEKALTGKASSSGDTRPRPDDPWTLFAERTYLTQGFFPGKTIEDIDSLIFYYTVSPLSNRFNESCIVTVLLHVDAHKEDFWKIGYLFKASDIVTTPQPPLKYLVQENFTEDTIWLCFEKNIGKDIADDPTNPVTSDASLDSLILESMGMYRPPWRGQKVFFDDIRLMGYADYDVGVKNILSGDGGSPYIPTAHIKNFGREPADFQVFAEIMQGETQLYIDSLPWSLPADTEDTVSFRTFTPLDTGTYILRIFTVMEPDESDADDELSKELHFTAIAEPVTPITHLDLKVNPICSGDVKVAYSLPNGHEGTLTLFDASGRRVDTKQVRGYGSASFTSDLISEVYFVKLEALGVKLSRKVVVVR